MGHIILAALCICCCVLTGTAELDEEQVGRVTAYIERRFTRDFNFEYAYFVKFSEDECKKGLSDQVIQEALRGENRNDMHNKVNDYEIYTGPRMVVSSYIIYKEGTSKEYSLHAEYRLLDPDYHSPISNLLSILPYNGCAIFYSKYSPCVSKCLLPDGDYNIVEKLQKVYALPKDKVFAFSNLFWNDEVTERRSEKVWASWETLNLNIPLFRCTGNNCVQCFKNGVQQDACYNGHIIDQ